MCRKCTFNRSVRWAKGRFGVKSDLHQVAHDAVGNENTRFGERKHASAAYEEALGNKGGSLPLAILAHRRAELLLDSCQIDAPHRAQAGQNVVVVAGAGVKRFFFEGRLPGGSSFEVGREGGDVPFSFHAVIRVGGGAEAEVFPAGPVSRVMLREAAGAGEVGYFVMQVAGIGQRVDQGREKAEACFLRHWSYFAGFLEPVEGRTFLIDQVVGRQVGNIQGKGLPQVGFPSGLGLPRQAVDQVDAQVVDAVSPAGFHRPDGLCGRMAAVEEAKVGVIETLYAHADAVEWEVAESGYILPCHIVGIGFEGDLAAPAGVEMAVDGFEQPFEIGRRKL